MQRYEVEDLYRKEHARLVFLLVKCGAPLAVAEDVATDSWIELLKRPETVHAPKAWLRKVALKKLAGTMVHERQKVSLDDANRADSADPSGEVHDQVVDAVEEEAVVKLFRKLPDAQRRVVALSYDGFGPTEIAEILNIPASTARSNLRHAKTRLIAEITRQRETAPGAAER